MKIGKAIKAMKNGKKVARKGWNGQNMFIYHVAAASYPAGGNTHGTMKDRFENDMVPYQEYIAMLTADNTVVPWLCSQSDLLAEDYVIVED